MQRPLAPRTMPPPILRQVEAAVAQAPRGGTLAEEPRRMGLPPYSPGLNPVENIWQFLRQNHLSNRVYETYEAIVDACCDAWNALVAEPKRITTIASRDWAEVRA